MNRFICDTVHNLMDHKIWVTARRLNLNVKFSSTYRNDLKFSDRYAWAKNVDPDQTAPLQTVQTQIRLQSDQGLHCLPFRLHRLDSLLCGRAIKFKF